MRFVLPLYATTIALGAVLLFSVQPLVARIILPVFGGAPSVWNAAMVFFQAMLLGGYLYAHVLSMRSGARTPLLVHVVVFLVALSFLPVTTDVGLPSAGAATIPALQVLTLLASLVGLPFLVLATTAPLLQRWFADTGHPHAADPYFLYAASNFGALVALLAYPVAIEPFLGLKDQTLVWSGGFVALAIAVTACGLMRDTSRLHETGTASSRAASPKPALATRGRWLLLSFVPSAALLGVTLHISTDVAAAPFLWVVPLALYLTTFMLTFARRPRPSHELMLKIQLPVYALLAVFFAGVGSWYALALHLGALFVTAMVCHGELARLRPPADHLTGFYLYLSAGGLLGGIFGGLLAPVVFDTVVEYPIIIILAALLRPGATDLKHWNATDLIAAAILLIIYIAPNHSPFRDWLGTYPKLDWAHSALLLALLLWFCRRPFRIALGLTILLMGHTFGGHSGELLARERSFFGVYTVTAPNNGALHVLHHGTTTHGAQPVKPPGFERFALTYYNPEGPAGQIFRLMSERGRLKEAGLVGLGVGTLACYRRPGQSFVFYEIDPLMVEIAEDSRLFRYLELCGEAVDVKVVDGRLGLAAEPEGRFDLIVLDAFSSDAIPIHLMTREAIALYLSRLSPSGVLAFHISNQYMSLEPVLGAIANDLQVEARMQIYVPDPGASNRGALASKWLVMAPSANLDIFSAPAWSKVELVDDTASWTDDFANVFRALNLRELVWEKDQKSLD